MQIRCKNCRMPFSIGREIVDQALNTMQDENLVHFDFRCPNCKKNNKVSQRQLLRAAPGWEYKATDKAEEEKETKKKETKKKTAK